MAKITDNELVDTLFEWAERNPRFDTTFLESVASQMSKRGSLSLKQREALLNIAYKFKVINEGDQT